MSKAFTTKSRCEKCEFIPNVFATLSNNQWMFIVYLKQSFSRNVTQDNFGGDWFIQKNLDVVLFLFWSYHKSSGLSLWIVKVDGWWKGIADMEISVESKKIDHEVQKQPLVINNTLETPWMHRTSFQICVICWGEKSLCFRWLLWCLLMLFPPRSVCSQHHLTNIGWCGIETMQPTRGSQLCKRICEVKARWLVSYRCISNNKKRQEKWCKNEWCFNL